MAEEMNVTENVTEEENNVFEVDMDTEQIMKEATETVRSEALNIIKEKDPQLEETIERLKIEYDEVYLYIFDPEQFYIYRPVKRGEYVRMMSQSEEEEDTQLMLVNTCILYPEVNFDETVKAGTIDVLVNLIMYASNFAPNNPVVKL